MQLDRDLASIQEARDLVAKSKAAQKVYAKADQSEVDKVVSHLADKLYNSAELLAEMAVSETGFGNVKDKIFKNQFASKNLYNYIKDMKTRGIISIDEQKKEWDVGVAVGVIVGLVPSTNPTSTAIYKSLISLKSGNSVIFSPHPAALKSITKAVELLREGLRECGHSEDLISVQSITSLEGTDTLMKHKDVGMILATGGSAMVKAAYSSGTPALGVGPGNVPAFIERTADVPKAVAMIIAGKTFDNGVICASEQAVVVERVMKDCVKSEFERQGCYFVNAEEKKALERVIKNPSGGLNAKIVGKTPQQIAAMAGISVPDNIRVIIAEETGVGKDYPFSMEKLSPLLAFYVEEGWEESCKKCIEILNFGGLGHSLGIHSQNMEIVREFALEKPVSRMLINTPTTHGAIGATTSLAPSLTLGCGSVGGSATSDNVTPLNLINIRRISFGLPQFDNDFLPQYSGKSQNSSACSATETSDDIIARIVKQVISELK